MDRFARNMDTGWSPRSDRCTYHGVTSAQGLDRGIDLFSRMMGPVLLVAALAFTIRGMGALFF